MRHSNLKSVVAVAVVAAVTAAAPASASIYDNSYKVTVSEGQTSSGFDVGNGNPFAAVKSGSNTASATFTYTGPLDFSNTAAQNTNRSGDLNSSFGFSTSNISHYSTPQCRGANCDTVRVGNLGTVADYTSLAAFLGSSGSAAGFPYGSYYEFDLGVVRAGTVLTITHDDGIALFQGNTRIGSTTSGPTEAKTETVRIGMAGDTVLRYSRQNGTPSILQVAVPEPMSMGLLGAGLATLGLVRRRRKA